MMCQVWEQRASQRMAVKVLRQRYSFGVLIALATTPVLAQHGRFTEELVDIGGEGIGPVTAVLAVLATVLIVTALFRGSDETNRRAAKPGLIGAAIGAFLGVLIGWPVGLLILGGVIGFFMGYGKQGP